jgi:hypothetical protein
MYVIENIRFSELAQEPVIIENIISTLVNTFFSTKSNVVL